MMSTVGSKALLRRNTKLLVILITNMIKKDGEKVKEGGSEAIEKSVGKKREYQRDKHGRC